jgi:hypothetical protein
LQIAPPTVQALPVPLAPLPPVLLEVPAELLEVPAELLDPPLPLPPLPAGTQTGHFSLAHSPTATTAFVQSVDSWPLPAEPELQFALHSA